MIAHPIETVQRNPEASAVQRILEIVAEYEAIEIVVGLPLNLRGEHTPSTADALHLAGLLAQAGAPVRLLDERLSTTAASNQLRSVGKSAKKQRAVIDQAAAVIILQQSLDTERASGHPAGKPFDPDL